MVKRLRVQPCGLYVLIIAWDGGKVNLPCERVTFLKEMDSGWNVPFPGVLWYYVREAPAAGAEGEDL
ncbi:hypothetical protein B5G12_02585 [Faecalibacterium sp. An58]|nr:hypothetical protein B5G12_02585 [Faecalibacterium sp. An58]